MCEPQKGRRKTLGFKPEGINPSHDMAFSVLDSLPKGAAVNFVVQAILEFLKNHSGETITISGKWQCIILGDHSYYNPSDEDTLSDLVMGFFSEN